ncbi:Gfo/Idh/MocA family oxidoreductase [bacterium]|nr:Gfo/Idh/MocA family oxidoreductase [bacterium]
MTTTNAEPPLQPVPAILIGIGGYGESYLSRLLDPSNTLVRIVAAVDPHAGRSAKLHELEAAGIPVLASLDACTTEASLAIVSSPIQVHREQTCACFSRGMHVLCEKPVAPLIQDVHAMIAARDAARRLGAVGYQWSFSNAVLALKADVMAGVLGTPVRLKTIVRWPRTKTYYTRNSWAGAIKDARGNWVLDSPVNNATAHYLHNMLFVLGRSLDRSATPATIEGELYRANDIQNYDTAAMRIMTTAGTEILFYSTHAVRDQRHPEFILEFEEAAVTFGGAQKNIIARFTGGTTKDYGSPDVDAMTKVWTMARAVSNAAVIPCGFEAAASHTLCVNGLQESCDILPFPAESVRRDESPGDSLTWVEGLAELFDECYTRALLPSETGAAWARKGHTMDLTSYTSYPHTGQ